MNIQSKINYYNISPDHYSTGSLIKEGKLHNKISLGCQDANFFIQTENYIIGVVCDGCSCTNFGLTQNQVGAILGSQFIAQTLANELKSIIEIDSNDIDFEKKLHITRNKTHTFFRNLTKHIGLQYSSVYYKEFVIKKLLFTVLGFVIFKNQFWIFGFGDGCYGINENIKIIKPNTNDYLNQSLLEKSKKQKQQFKIFAYGNTHNLNYLWISSDGLSEVLYSKSGKKEFLNFINDEFTCQRNTKDEDITIQAFNRKIYNRNKYLFSDDVSIIVVKKKL